MLDNVPKLPAVRVPVAPQAVRRDRRDVLERLCSEELLTAFGLDESQHGRRALELLFRGPVRRLAAQISAYDEIVGVSGLGAGGAWALDRMARRVEVTGQEHVPREGPLLLVSNHPGLADAVALFTATPRDDLRVVAAERPFLEALPNTSRYLLTVDERSRTHLAAVRAAVRHLRRGGAVLTFPGGRIEPDPAVLPGAAEALDDWSESVDLFAQLVPDLAVVPAAVSGVLSPAALRNPLVLLRRREQDRRWLAATIQMLVPALRNVTTRVAFGDPIRADVDGTEVSRRAVAGMRALISGSAPRKPGKGA